MSKFRVLRALTYQFVLFSFTGCWHGMLIVQNIFNYPDKLIVSTEKFPDGQVGSDYNFLTEIIQPGVPALGCRIKSGALPPGLRLESKNNSATEHRSKLQLTGTPTSAGLYKFKVYCGCCMTMSGPAFQGEKQFEIIINDVGRLNKDNNYSELTGGADSSN